jgi:hypothetical protein
MIFVFEIMLPNELFMNGEKRKKAPHHIPKTGRVSHVQSDRLHPDASNAKPRAPTLHPVASTSLSIVDPGPNWL